MQLPRPNPLLNGAHPDHFPEYELGPDRSSLHPPRPLVICLSRIAKQPAADLQALSLAALFHFHHRLAPRFFRIGISNCSSAMSIIAFSSRLYSRASSNSLLNRITSAFKPASF